MTTTPSKEAQVAAAIGQGTREQDAPGPDGPRGEITDAMGDLAPVDTAPRREAADDTTTPAPRLPQRPDKRTEIAARFREDRGTDDSAADVDEIRRFANQGLPPELVGDDDEPADRPGIIEPEADVEDAPTPKRKLKIRGQDVELTDDELIVAAQRGLAGDSYFDEARAKADQASAALERVTTLLLRQNEQGVRAPVTEHPGGGTAETPVNGQPEHPEVDPYIDVVKQITYEDPEKAAASLRALVEGTVRVGSRTESVAALQESRKADELARSKRAMSLLAENNADIASDPRAVAALQQDIAEMQLKDLRDLGLEDAVLPKTRDEIGRWHLFYRAEGMKVRPMSELFDTAVAGFREWKGGSAEPPEDAGRAKPRVEVRLDRSERRANIPQQPTRAVSPRPDRQQAAPSRDRAAVVQDMIRQRGAPRGRITG